MKILYIAHNGDIEEMPLGSEILIRLFIPPQIKLLGEIRGKVAWVNTGDFPLPKGMGIRFETTEKEALKQLVTYFGEEKHLIDQKV